MKYIDMHKMLQCFKHDPDLAPLHQHKLGSIMLQFYILTGCDYISFVSGTGKATFLKIFFQHAAFINGAEYEGCLSQNQPCDVKQGYLSLIRLIGTVYFKKHLSSVVSKLGFETPDQLYKNIEPSLSVEERHNQWYLNIKRVIFVQSEDQRPPTLTSLWQHWSRA